LVITRSGVFKGMFPLMDKTQSAKLEIEKVNGKNNFEIWKVKMHDLLVQQGVVKVIFGKAKQPATIIDDD
jgi:predicted enzyme involved in methoxymalonyl-ACP biosynthesis